MGLFSFFVKSPADREKKGDALVLASHYGPARIEYAKALEALSGKVVGQDALRGRIEEKYAGCGEMLARIHLESAVDLHESGIDAEAHHLLYLASQLASEGETKKAIADLMALLNSAMAHEGEEWEPAEKGVKGELPREDEAFEALCFSLPEDQATAYLGYGDAFKRGYSALNAGSFAEAEGALDEALEANGLSSYVAMELATACEHLGKNEKAKALLETFLIHYPTHTHGVELLCHLHVKEGDSIRALALLEEAIGAMETISVAFIVLKGRLLSELHGGEAAETWLEGHLKNQWEESIAFLLARLKKARGESRAARELLATSMGRCAGCGRRPPSHIRLMYSDILREEGDVSVSLIERYLTLAMEDPATASNAYGAVSDIYRRRGDIGEADRYAAMVEGPEQP